MPKKRYGKSAGFEDYISTSSDIENIVRLAFGDTACRYAVELAEMDDFDEFADALSNLGLSRCEGTGRGADVGAIPSKFVNAILSMRYPFLITHMLNAVELRDVTDEEIIKGKSLSREAAQKLADNMFTYTHYGSIPDGWASRFGLEICEDIRTILESGEDGEKAVACYMIEDIKEKYGTLRWYDYIVTESEDIREAMYDLNHVYEMLSGATCIECGATQDVLMTNSGWISALCYEHLRRSWREDDAIDVFSKNHGYEKGWVGFDLSRMINKYLTCSGATPMTVEPEKLILTWTEGGEKKEKRPYDELKREYPHLQVFKLMEESYNVNEIEVPSIEEIEAKIQEENAKA